MRRNLPTRMDGLHPEKWGFRKLTVGKFDRRQVFDIAVFLELSDRTGLQVALDASRQERLVLQGILSWRMKDFLIGFTGNIGPHDVVKP